MWEEPGRAPHKGKEYIPSGKQHMQGIAREFITVFLEYNMKERWIWWL